MIQAAGKQNEVSSILGAPGAAQCRQGTSTALSPDLPKARKQHPSAAPDRCGLRRHPHHKVAELARMGGASAASDPDRLHVMQRRSTLRTEHVDSCTASGMASRALGGMQDLHRPAFKPRRPACLIGCSCKCS